MTPRELATLSKATRAKDFLAGLRTGRAPRFDIGSAGERNLPRTA
jgi:hypothetical protein